MNAKNQDLLCSEGNHEEIYDPVKGEFICGKCGLVCGSEFDRSADLSPEKISDLNSRIKNTYFGNREELVDGLGSYIDFHNAKFMHDCNYHPLPPRNRFLFGRLKKRYELKSRLGLQRREFEVLAELTKIASDLKLSDSDKRRAAHIYREISLKLQAAGDIKRKNIRFRVLGLAIVLMAKESKNGKVLTVQEVAASFQKFNHRVSGYNIIRTALLLKCELDGILKTHRSKRSEEYIHTIVNQIVSDERIKARIQTKIPKPAFEYKKALIFESQALLERIPDKVRGGRNPYCLAISAVYGVEKYLSKKWRYVSIFGQRLVAEITGINEWTVKNGWKLLIEPLIHN